MKTRIDYNLTNDQLAEIERAINASPYPEVRQRAIAIRLLHTGQSAEQAAEVVRVKPGTLYSWHRRWREHGVDGLHDNHRSARAPKANPADAMEIARMPEIDPHSLERSFTIWTITLTRLQQMAHLTQDEQGNPVVQLPQQQWEASTALLESQTNPDGRLQMLLQNPVAAIDVATSPTTTTIAALPLVSGNGESAALAVHPALPAPPRRRHRQSRLEDGLQAFIRHYLRHYQWSLLPLILIVALLVNNRLLYNTFFGYDMPQHFNNVLSIMGTGKMPTDSSGANFQAQQAPLFYVLAAWVTTLGNAIFDDGFQKFATLFLLPIALAWVAVLTVMVQTVLRRVHPVLRAATLCVIALLPVNVEAMGMFSNDLPVALFGTLAAFILWLMTRSGRQLDIRMWLRAAAISGLAIAFKNNGVILLGTYVLLAGYIGLGYGLERRFRRALRVLVYAAVGLPLMLVPFLLNTVHVLGYMEDPVGAIGEVHTLAEYRRWGYFLGLDNRIFERPYAFGPGESSFWSMQYVTLHSDYYNHWRSDAYLTWPSDVFLETMLPIDQFNTAVVLQFIAVPITVVVVLGFLYSLFRVLLRPWYALRDGSVFVVLFTVVAQAALAALAIRYPFAFPVVVHARYLLFVYPLLLMVGVQWLWSWFSGYRRWQRPARRIYTHLLAAVFAAYALVAFKYMWLPAP